jgi:hypothetical protein
VSPSPRGHASCRIPAERHTRPGKMGRHAGCHASSQDLLLSSYSPRQTRRSRSCSPRASRRHLREASSGEVAAATLRSCRRCTLKLRPEHPPKALTLRLLKVELVGEPEVEATRRRGEHIPATASRNKEKDLELHLRPSSTLHGRALRPPPPRPTTCRRTWPS